MLTPGGTMYELWLRYGEEWVLHCRARTEKRIRERRRELPQWPADKVKALDPAGVDIYASRKGSC